MWVVHTFFSWPQMTQYFFSSATCCSFFSLQLPSTLIFSLQLIILKWFFPIFCYLDLNKDFKELSFFDLEALFCLFVVVNFFLPLLHAAKISGIHVGLCEKEWSPFSVLRKNTPKAQKNWHPSLTPEKYWPPPMASWKKFAPPLRPPQKIWPPISRWPSTGKKL